MLAGPGLVSVEARCSGDWIQRREDEAVEHRHRRRNADIVVRSFGKVLGFVQSERKRTRPLHAVIGDTHFCTSRGPFAHLWRTPLRW